MGPVCSPWARDTDSESWLLLPLSLWVRWSLRLPLPSSVRCRQWHLLYRVLWSSGSTALGTWFSPSYYYLVHPMAHLQTHDFPVGLPMSGWPQPPGPKGPACPITLGGLKAALCGFWASFCLFPIGVISSPVRIQWPLWLSFLSNLPHLICPEEVPGLKVGSSLEMTKFQQI